MTRVGSPATDRENDDAEIGEVLSLKLGKRDVIVELDHIQYTTTVQPDAIFARDKNLGRVHDPSRKTRGVYDLEGRRNLYDVAPEDRLGDLVFTVAGRTGPVLADMMMFEESFRERMIIGDDEKEESPKPRLVNMSTTLTTLALMRFFQACPERMASSLVNRKPSRH